MLDGFDKGSLESIAVAIVILELILYDVFYDLSLTKVIKETVQ